MTKIQRCLISATGREITQESGEAAGTEHQQREQQPDTTSRERLSTSGLSALKPPHSHRFSTFLNTDAYSTKYVPLGYRTANSDETAARRIARDLKNASAEAVKIAATAMAALIEGSCWLVPVPASDGSLTANLALAQAIAELVPGARVKCAVARAHSHSVESSCERRLRGLPGLTVDEHAIIRTAGPMDALPVHFVDNVITTGTTIAACRRALGWGTGIAYADASTPHNTRRRP